MTGPQARNHEIELAAAAALTARHRAMATVQGTRAPEEGSLGGMFTREAVIKLLQQPNARFLRFYYGRNEKGARELVLVAADAAGNDLATMSMDGHYPCPPFCPTSPSMLRG